MSREVTEQKTLRPRRRPQFTLRTLLATVTAVSIVLATGSWIGWPGLLCIVHIGGLLAMMALPVVVVLFELTTKGRAYIGPVSVVAGALLLFNVAATGILIELLLRSFAWDLVPYDGVVEGTLNVFVPVAVAGLTLGFMVGKRTACLWVGATLIALGVAASIGYGYYFHVELFEEPLADYVWWM